MDPIPRSVKPRRSYESPRRAEQARQTRSVVVAAARQLFLRDGFAATTVAAVAAEGGVSAETVYKTFGGKPGLVRAVCEEALAGVGPVAAEVRSDELQRSLADPRMIIRGWGELMAEVSPRIAPILLLLRAAAESDPDTAALLAEQDAIRLTRMTSNAKSLAGGGHLRTGVSVAEAADVLWSYSSPEMYELLVERRSWSPRRYSEFVADAMIAALLPRA